MYLSLRLLSSRRMSWRWLPRFTLVYATSHMPLRMTIGKLHIDDSKHSRKHCGPAIVANFNARYTSAKYIEEHPQVRTQEVMLENITTASGQTLPFCGNASYSGT
jgi:hypothetical protein